MSNQEKPKFRSVSLSTNLVDEIESFIKKHKQYRSIADFVSEASRRHMEPSYVIVLTLPPEQASLPPEQLENKKERHAQ